MQELLLAGPGTGKTTYIKNLLQNHDTKENILILSFTKATIKDLLKSFKEKNIGITPKQCMTVHKFAFKINPKKDFYILNEKEEKILKSLSEKLGVELRFLCQILQCETFDQMIENSINLIRNNPVYIKEELGTLDLLIIDEYQDLNSNDRELINLLLPFSLHTLILGDDDQAIYEFRNASNEGILSKYKDDNFIKIPYENICYRCPIAIVNYCNSLISHNQNRIVKSMKAYENNREGAIIQKQFRAQEETAKWIIEEIKKINANPDNQNDSIMILSCIKTALDQIKKEFVNQNIRYTSLYRKNISDKLQKQIWEILSIYIQKNLVPTICSILSGSSSTKIKPFIKELSDQLRKSTKYEDLQKTVYPFLKKNIITAIKTRISIDSYVSNNNFTEIENFLHENNLGEDPLTFLTEAISDETSFDDTGINIMSIHKSKGLSAKHVFIVGLVNGFLPNKSININSLEEQRRILYVGMSRAEKSLYLISTLEWEYYQIMKGDKTAFTCKKKNGKNSFYGYTSTFLQELSNPMSKKNEAE